MQASNPEISSTIEKFKKGMKKKAPLEEVFDPSIVTPEEIQVEEGLHKMTEALQAISDEDFKR